MNCPYCKKEMDAGFIKSNGEIINWTPVGERKPCTRWGIAKNALQLGDYTFFRGGMVIAYHCWSCRKTIINE